MLWGTEQFSPLCFGQYVCIRIDAFFIQQIQVHKMISDLVRWVTKHQHNFFTALRDAAQANCKSVSAEDWENNTNRITAKLVSHICRNVVDTDIISLCAGYNCLRHTHHVSVSRNQPFHVHSFNDRAGYDVHQIVALADDRSPDTH